MISSMIKRLTTHGNSLALVIEKGILELLGINKRTPLRISTDGKCLVITPVKRLKHEERVQEALEKVTRDHSKTLKALAG